MTIHIPDIIIHLATAVMLGSAMIYSAHVVAESNMSKIDQSIVLVLCVGGAFGIAAGIIEVTR